MKTFNDAINENYEITNKNLTEDGLLIDGYIEMLFTTPKRYIEKVEIKKKTFDVTFFYNEDISLALLGMFRVMTAAHFQKRKFEHLMIYLDEASVIGGKLVMTFRTDAKITFIQ